MESDEDRAWDEARFVREADAKDCTTCQDTPTVENVRSVRVGFARGGPPSVVVGDFLKVPLPHACTLVRPSVTKGKKKRTTEV